MKNYISEAIKTVSSNWYGDKVKMVEFLEAINEASIALGKLDRIKKQLFYGKDLDSYDEVRNMIPVSYLFRKAKSIPLLHGILGIAIEAGELLECLNRAFSDEYDWVNIKEELGDSQWYHALIAYTGGFTFEEIQEMNIAKLQKKRYSNGYSDEAAINRDVEAERELMKDFDNE